MNAAQREARLAELAAEAVAAGARGEGWVGNELWREYELVKDGGRDPDELIAEGVALSYMAMDLAAQTGRPAK